jgi:hypothetical protein
MVCPICRDFKLAMTRGAIIIDKRNEVTIEKMMRIDNGAKIELNKKNLLQYY